ncbi:DUF4386 domain-containing protein [Costertonia aggregata]|uniref:DUF4386 domain-containing protein n=1 Tax=Costertonia aggregata TaxID=343403 RepID=A0A7H9AML8_9FLAO|nr:DUF4386 domain-containing protein [Costertonia aggregata]QLG44702.1 DUF4386 domain-containing protein [Costertonia aggregata]
MDKEKAARNKTARLGGLLYLLLVICGLVYLVYVPSQLIVWDNAETTLVNIQKSEGLFKIGILVAICSFIIFMLLPLALYRLLSQVNKKVAFLMVLFAVVSVPISFVNILNKFTILDLVQKSKGSGIIDVIPADQVLFHLEQYSNGLEVLQVFWGLWLLPFGYLVYKSGFLPKLLGVLLMAGCFGYLVTFTGGFLVEDFSKTTLSSIIGIPAALGEIGIALWLLIFGTNNIGYKKN